MADVTITGLPNAAALTGTERVPMDQAGVTVDAAASAIAGLATKTTVGLSNVDNTSDANKPISTATATALAGKVAIGAPVPTLLAVRNNSGGALAIGTAVYVTGSSGTSPTVAAADASTEATAARTIGLMYATAAHNSDGIVITHGLLAGVTTPLLTEGQITWLSETAGQLTSTRPTQPAHGVFMGFCIKQGPGTSGILYVNVINGQELEELHDVLISGAATGQVLALAADGQWKNKTLAAGDVGADPTGTAAAAVAMHAAAADPHPGYLTPAEGSSAYAPLASVHDPVTLGASVSGVLGMSGQVLGADDPGGDRILFWDDSAGSLTHLSTDSALLIDGTVLRALSTLVIPLTGEAVNLTNATLVTVPYWPETRVLTALPIFMVNTAPTGSVAQFDIRIGGTSIFATLPTIDATEISTATAATPAVFSAAFISSGYTFALGSSVSFHCTQIGATVAGAGLKVALPSRRAS
jgi:hypothetical protein